MGKEVVKHDGRSSLVGSVGKRRTQGSLTFMAFISGCLVAARNGIGPGVGSRL